MGFSIMASALANTGLRTRQQAEREGARIAQAEAEEARLARQAVWERAEARRKEAFERAKQARRATVAQQVAASRAAFESEPETFTREDVVKVRGRWIWRTGRWVSRPVSEETLRKNGLR
jgi:hypothetical protein